MEMKYNVNCVIIRRGRLVVKALVLIVIAMPWFPAAQPVKADTSAKWLQFRGPNYNGISTERGFKTDWGKGEPKQIWQAAVDRGFSSVVISDGRLYTIGNADEKDIVYCLAENNGELIWKYSYPEPYDSRGFAGGPHATPTIHDDKVYTISRQGCLYCFDKVAGTVIWYKHLQEDYKIKIPEWGFTGSPIIMKDLLIINAGTAGMAVNKDSGDIVWLTGTEIAGYSTPVPFELSGRQYVGIFMAESVAAVEAFTGKVYWQYPWKTPYKINVADPIIVKDKVFVSSWARILSSAEDPWSITIFSHDGTR